jgi:hypothetical protein
MTQTKFLALDARFAARLALTGASLDKGWTLGYRGDLFPQGSKLIKLLSLEKVCIDGINKLSNHGLDVGHCSGLVISLVIGFDKE